MHARTCSGDGSGYVLGAPVCTRGGARSHGASTRSAGLPRAKLRAKPRAQRRTGGCGRGRQCGCCLLCCLTWRAALFFAALSALAFCSSDTSVLFAIAARFLGDCLACGDRVPVYKRERYR